MPEQLCSQQRDDGLRGAAPTNHTQWAALILPVWWKVPSRGPFPSSKAQLEAFGHGYLSLSCPAATFWNVHKDWIRKFVDAPTFSRK